MFASVNMGPLKATTPNRLESRSEHFPYGEQKGAAPPDNDKDYFTTYRRDESGLDYAWNRYYSPAMGRFTTADPGPYVYDDPRRMNLYVYSSGDPVNRYDPDGRFWKELFGGIAGFFGGGKTDHSSGANKLGDGNDMAEPDEGLIGADGGGGESLTSVTSAIHYGNDLNSPLNGSMPSVTVEIGIPLITVAVPVWQAPIPVTLLAGVVGGTIVPGQGYCFHFGVMAGLTGPLPPVSGTVWTSGDTDLDDFEGPSINVDLAPVGLGGSGSQTLTGHMYGIYVGAPTLSESATNAWCFPFGGR